MYTSIIVVALIILNANGKLVPDVPFKYYGIDCVKDGKSVTYRLDTLKEGDEVLCRLDYRSSPHQNPDILVEKEIAEAFAGNLGNDWEKIQKDARYLKHYSVTKETALATTNELGNTIPYNGIDKDEITKFTQWDTVSSTIEDMKEVV